MSENAKLILKPKVRFSQCSDKKRNNEIKKSNKDDINLQTNGPKIRSIVTLERPVRIVDSMESTNACEKNSSVKNCEIKMPPCSDDIAFEYTQDTSLPSDNMPETEVSKMLCNANSDQNKENDKSLQLDKNTRMQHNTSKHRRKILQQKDKENKDTVLKRIMSNKNIIRTKIKNSQYKQPIVYKKLQLSTSSNDIQKINNTNCKKIEMTKSKSAPSIIKRTEKHTSKTRTLDPKPTPSNVMPCYRYTKTGIMRNKVSQISPVKRTVLCNTTDAKIKTSVGSGICHKQKNVTKPENPSEKCHIISDAVEKLAQPEYNSIMCTLDKLTEIKQQKSIRDINYLPSVQKNLLNGKISTALDFPLNEVIFKNLVDLSIDDKQMSTIIRTKDPEPRQKDITPELSNFFVPEHMKDICTLIHVKLRAPKINEDWDIYKISNKILDWRHNLDDVR